MKDAVVGARARAPGTGPRREPRVVIAHDYLTQRGGAERVVLAMKQAFPDAPIVTSVYNPDSTYPEFSDFEVRPSWLSRFSEFRRDPRQAFPLLASVWARTHIDDADVVLCSSTGWAHGVSTNAPKIVYCHNPARWLYQSQDYVSGSGIGIRTAVKTFERPLRVWDQRAAHSATRYLANSSVVARRVKQTYGIDATVVHPPAAISSGPTEPVAGLAPGYLLTVGRARGYKNTEAVARAVCELPDERLVAVGGLPDGNWCERIRGVTDVSDAQLRWLYQNADALVACAYEDFGLTPIEAYSVGTPAVVLRAGGYLDTTRPGVTGEFADTATPADIAQAIRLFRASSYSPSVIMDHASQFTIDSFGASLRKAITEIVPVAS